MDGNDLKKATEAARALERRGEAAAAIDAFVRLGMIEDAVRVAAGAGKFLEAAQIALRALGNDVRSFGGLEGPDRRLALRAGILLAEAGQHPRAVEIFQALGEHDRAQDTVKKARNALLQAAEGPAPNGRVAAPDPAALARARELEAAGQAEAALAHFLSLQMYGESGRIARKLGRPGEAARHYVEAGMSYEAALCFHEARDEGRCFEQLVRVPPHHERYRTACGQAIRIAAGRDQVSFQLDRLVSPFLAGSPQNEKEQEVFYSAARLYERHGQRDMALEILERLLRAAPYYRDVPELIGALRKGSNDPSRDARIQQEDASFLRSPRGPSSPSPGELLGDLPDLPPLPGASPPSIPRKAPAGTSVLAGASPAAATGFVRNQTPPAQGAPAAAARVSAGASTQAVAPPPPPPPPSGAHLGALPPGAMVGERYRVEGKLGQGGMATVYKVHDLELDERVAMKVFLPGQESPELLARFRQELLLSRQLSHANVVRLHDIGVFQGCRFLTMELLHGQDLGSLLKQQDGPIDFLRGLRYLIQACAGLHAAHERNIVHRDVKPDNFFIVSPGDTLKVMDFGIAKRRDAPGLTQAGYLAGTPYYMAPEQINNFTGATHLADLYALGVVAFQMFTGRVPFDNNEMMALLIMHLTDAPPSPRAFNPAIPPELDALILRLLEKDPEKRPKNCRELARSLQEIGARLTQQR